MEPTQQINTIRDLFDRLLKGRYVRVTSASGEVETGEYLDFRARTLGVLDLDLAVGDQVVRSIRISADGPASIDTVGRVAILWLDGAFIEEIPRPKDPRQVRREKKKSERRKRPPP